LCASQVNGFSRTFGSNCRKKKKSFKLRFSGTNRTYGTEWKLQCLPTANFIHLWVTLIYFYHQLRTDCTSTSEMRQWHFVHIVDAVAESAEPISQWADSCSKWVSKFWTPFTILMAVKHIFVREYYFFPASWPLICQASSQRTTSACGNIPGFCCYLFGLYLTVTP
jgi:hypothetical protein